MTVSIDLTDGDAVTVWQTTTGVFFERFDGNGDPVGSPTQVAATDAAWISATPLADGGFSVFWDSSSTGPATAQDYDASGTAIGAAYAAAAPPTAALAFTSLAETETNSATNGDNSTTALLPDSGTVVASFGFDASANAYAEQIQQYDAAGNAIGQAFVVDASMNSNFQDGQIAPLVDGSYVVSYLQQSSFNSQLEIEHFAADGTPLAGSTVTSAPFTGDFTYYPEIFEQSIAGLPDGGFVIGWTEQDNAPPQAFSEEFAASGAAGPVVDLGAVNAASTAAPEIDVFADGGYTVSWAGLSGEQSASFTEQGAALASATNDQIVTAALDYTFPDGPHVLTLVGDYVQTVAGNDLGDTITSNDYGSTIAGGTGNDTLIAGHGADTLTGNGGDDSFVFNYLPWNAGHITDFNTAADTLNLGGIFNAIGYSGSDPAGDGYLQFVSDGDGNTRVYVDTHQASDPWPTLVTTLDNVSPSSITPADYGYDPTSTSGGGSGTGDPGVTLTANDTAGQQLTGTPGNDTFYAEQNSVVMTGDGGHDTFIFNALPWNAGSITDFNTASDTLDLSGIFNSIGYTGSDPVADGYLTFQSDGNGDTQVLVDSHSSSDPWPTLITTLDGVAPSSVTPADYGYGSNAGGGGSGSGGDSGNGNPGVTLTANDTPGEQLTGTPGNDTFYAGHNSVIMTGDGGDDSFLYNYLPWNAGSISDFNTSTDTLDLSGIMQSIGYSGSNPQADGYVNFVDDGQGNTKVYVDPQGPSTQIPILVTTLEHVSPAALHQSSDYMFT